MSKMTACEILHKLETLDREIGLSARCYATMQFEGPYDGDDEDMFDGDYLIAATEFDSDEEFVKSWGLGEIIRVEQKGGSDQGSYWSTVKYFKDHDVYIKTTGWYSSYEGVNCDNGFGHEVFPEEKVIIVYVDKK